MTWSTGGLLLLCISLYTATVKADFYIGFSPRGFSNPNNTLYNGTCCVPECSECTVSLRFCFRESGHPHSDTTSLCSGFRFDRNSPTQFSVFGTDGPSIHKNYTGSFQVYIRVSDYSNSDTPHFVPPFIDPLIDNIFIEVTDLAAGSFENRNSLVSVPYDATGEFGRASIQLRVNVHCASKYNGSDCSTFCENINGELVCEQETYDTPMTGESITTPLTTTDLPDQQTTTTTMSPLEVGDNNNILPIVVGVSVGGTVVLFLLVGFIISIIFFIVKVWIRNPYDKKIALQRVDHGSQLPLTSVSPANTKEVENGSLNEMYATVNKMSSKEEPYYSAENNDTPNSYQVLNDIKSQGLIYADLDMSTNNNSAKGDEESCTVTYTTVQHQ